MLDLDHLDAKGKEDVRDALLKLNIEAAQERLLPFIEFVNPFFVRGRHHEIIAEHMEAVESGEIKRLMVFMPPRASKSFMISEFFPAWYFGRHPRHQVLAISYNIDLAQDFGRKVRNIIRSPEYQRVFKDTKISQETRAANHWMTEAGGVYNAAGVTGRIAGKGAHLGLIDDPLNEQDAYSEAARKHVIRWWPAGFTSRLMPGGRVVVLQTRWHEEDLAGFLLEDIKTNPLQEKWTTLSIPALLDNAGSKLLGYMPGTTFWPPEPNPPSDAELAGWSTKELEMKKAGMPDYQWQALYMQNPTMEGGNIIKNEYWQDWTDDEPPELFYSFLSCDTAYSEKDTASYTAITHWGIFYNENNIPCLILLGAKKGRWPYHEMRDKIMLMYEELRPDVILVEQKASGQSLLQDLAVSGLPSHPFNPDRDKVARAHSISPLMNAGRVYAPLRHDWAQAVIDECAAFPTGRDKDYVDCTTQAVIWARDGLFISHPSDVAAMEMEEDDWSPAKRRQKYY